MPTHEEVLRTGAREKAAREGREPAFPAPEASVAIYGHPDYLTGITVRDYFAINANDQDIGEVIYSAFVRASGTGQDMTNYQPPTRQEARYAHADAMLAARMKRQEPA